MQEQQQQLLAQIGTSWRCMPPPDPQAATSGNPESAAQEERRRQLIELLAEIEKRINEENARPKKRYISPATREEVYAVYYDALRRKIEDRGTDNFPESRGQEALRRADDDRDRRLRRHACSTPRSCEASGNRALDRRAIAIVAAAGAVRPLHRCDAAQGRPDRACTSRFKFTRDETLETTAHRQPMS